MAARSSLPKPDKTVADENAKADSSENHHTIEVIRKRPDFVAANRGKRFVTPGFILLAHKRGEDHPANASTIRYGITVTKKIGNAVARNRMKRRFRALLHESLSDHGIAGADHILIGRKQGHEPDFAAMQIDLEKALRHLRKKLG